MPLRHADLYGSAPDKAAVALLLIDVINDLEFPEGEQLLKHALPIARRIAWLKQELKHLGVPAVYVNDNFGRWRSDFQNQVDHCLHDGVRGQPIAELLQPDEDDYFVLKPMHSGFYSTTLELLINHFQAKTLVLAGLATNICVLFTANDAYLRGYSLVVPSDCVAANTPEDNDYALAQMEQILKADTRPAQEVVTNVTPKWLAASN